MKKVNLLLISSLMSLCGYAQTDTIFTNNEKISCNIKEVTQDAVKFAYPGEEITNTFYKNTILKIKFKSGRLQTFSEATSFKSVSCADDYENVSTTQVLTEVQGLFKLGDVSSKAKGTTTFSSMEKVKERAYKKMKIVAAMMGANIVYLTQNETKGNQMGSRFQAGNSTETNLTGVAYSNRLPSYDDFIKITGNRTQFQCIGLTKLSQRDADMEKEDYSKGIQVFKIYNESGLIMVKAKMDGVDTDLFRVISYNSTEFILVYKDGERIYNYKIKA